VLHPSQRADQDVSREERLEVYEAEGEWCCVEDLWGVKRGLQRGQEEVLGS